MHAFFDLDGTLTDPKEATYMDVGRYDSREGGGRVAPGAATENNAGAIVEHYVLYRLGLFPTILCISSIHGGQVRPIET